MAQHAEATQHEKVGALDRLLWRIARLHPGWVTLIVCIGFLAYVLGEEASRGNPVAAALSSAAIMLFYLGYPLFVLFFVPGRFRSRTPRRSRLTLAALVVLAAFLLFTSFVDQEWYGALLESKSPIVVTFHVVLVLSGFISFLYVVIGASIALAVAEKGPAARFWRKFRTLLQFFYLPLCVYFLHRRIARLVSDFEQGDPIVVNFPLEALEIERRDGKHLALRLTGQVGWEDFERYAEELLRRLDGQAGATDCIAGMHLWNLTIETIPLQLAYEDYPDRIWLESDSHAGDMLLRKLHRRLAPVEGLQAGASASNP